MTKVALASGYISQNVGNAFFELGAYALLSRCVGIGNVFPIQDVPANWTLWRKANGIQPKWWNILERLDVDAFVFQGPTLTENFEVVWDGVLGRLRAANIEPVMLSIGFSKYTQEEQRQAVRMIKKHGIVSIFTRDTRTYEMLSSVNPTYSGIDSAFFAPWAYMPPRLNGPDYIVSCFESMDEPLGLIDRLTNHSRDDSRSLCRSSLLTKLAALTQSSAYMRQAIRGPNSASMSGPYEIVRTVHRTNPAVHVRMFKDANSIASDEPFTYLTTYANASFTVTDRVHAAVATLAYGRPAMMLSETPRRALLERVGIGFPMTAPVELASENLESERRRELQELSAVLR